MRAFIERLDRERNDALATIDGALERAASEDRDLTQAEDSMCNDARSRLDTIERQRSEWTELAERRANGDELAGRINGALARSGNVQTLQRVENTPDAKVEAGTLWRDAGHYIADFVSRKTNPEAEQRLQRAIANQVLADNPGIVPTPIVGPVISMLNRARPFVNSVANRPMPGGGQVFTRPIVNQHTLVGPQTAEKTELPSQKMTISKINVTKSTYGGALDISFQDRDWTDPALLQIVVDDLAGVYGRETDNAAVDAFATAVTQTTAAPSMDGPGLIKALAAASGLINAATNMMPDTLWVSPDVWGGIAGLSDTTGRALFTIVGSGTNASGTTSLSSTTGNVYGLNLVVDANLAIKTAIVGISGMTEFYEQVGGQLSVVEPTILGFTVAYYGYVAWCTPVPSAFCKVTGIIALEAGDQSAPVAPSAGR